MTRAMLSSLALAAIFSMTASGAVSAGAASKRIKATNAPSVGKLGGIKTNQESFKSTEDNYTLGQRRGRLRQKTQ